MTVVCDHFTIKLQLKTDHNSLKKDRFIIKPYSPVTKTARTVPRYSAVRKCRGCRQRRGQIQESNYSYEQLTRTHLVKVTSFNVFNEQ